MASSITSAGDKCCKIFVHSGQVIKLRKAEMGAKAGQREFVSQAEFQFAR